MATIVPNRFTGSGGLPAASLVGTLTEGAGGLVGVDDSNYLEATYPTLAAAQYQHYLFRVRRDLPTRSNYLVSRTLSSQGGIEIAIVRVATSYVIRAELFTSAGASLGFRDLYETVATAGDDLWLCVEVRENGAAGAGAIRTRTFDTSGTKLQDTITYGVATKPTAGSFTGTPRLGRDTGTGLDASEVEGDGLQWAVITHSASLSDAEVGAFVTSGSAGPGTGVWWYGILDAEAPPTPTGAGGTLGRPATRGGPGVWLLDLDLGAETLHVGTRPAAPRVRALGLERVSYATGLDDFDFVSGSERVAVRVQYRYMATLRRRVGPFRGRRFRLWRWHPDLVLEDTYLALEGVVDAASWADPDDADGVSLTLARDVRGLSLTYPTADMVIDAETWPDHDDNIRGEPYPVVIGAPGSAIVAGGNPIEATPGYLVDVANHTILVAGHRVAAAVVRVWNLTQQTLSTSRPIVHVEDGLGRVVATVDGTGAFSGASSPNAGDEIVVGWERADAWGPGLLGFDGAILGAGDLLTWGVQYLSRGVWDLAKMAQYRDALNAFRIDTFWNDPTNWEDWVQANVLSVFPIEEIQGPQGRYYRPIVYETDRSKVRAVLATPGSGAGRRVSRVSAVAEKSGEIANFVEVLYAGQYGSSAYRRRLSLGPRRGEVPRFTGIDERVGADFRARVSETYLDTRMRTIHIPQTWDSSTAFAAARYAIASGALPAQVATYEGGDDLLDLSEYDTVEVWDTASGADFRGDLGIVQDVTILPDGARVTVSVPWDPLRRPTVPA